MSAVWNSAIWRKTWGDQRGLVLALAALWGVFPWLFLWLSAQIPMPAFQDVLLILHGDSMRSSLCSRQG